MVKCFTNKCNPNAPPKVFDTFDTSLVGIQIKFDKNVPNASIGQKLTLSFHPLIGIRDGLEQSISNC